MENTFTAIIKKIEQGCIGYISEAPGVNKRGTTVEETHNNVNEVLNLVLATRDK